MTKERAQYIDSVHTCSLCSIVPLQYVTVLAKTRHIHTQTEIHFIAPAYSYTK